MRDLKQYIILVKELNKRISITQVDYEPVLIENLPEDWDIIGKGNYTGVFAHKKFPHYVVKIYGEDDSHLQNEAEVYKKIGHHPNFSTCYHIEDNFIILKRIIGITLYEAVIQGEFISEKIILDIDKAISDIEKKGICQKDVHGKNIIMRNGKGYIIDVSDFNKDYSCKKWEHLRKYYFKVYLPIYKKFPNLKTPSFMLNAIRKSYQVYMKFKKIGKYYYH